MSVVRDGGTSGNGNGKLNWKYVCCDELCDECGGGVLKNDVGEEISGGVGSGKAAESSGKELKLWLRGNPGVVRDLGRPGARKHVAKLRRWRRRDYGRMLWGSDDGMCGAAALVQAIDSVVGRVVAEPYYRKLREMCPTLDSLSRMTEVQKQMKLVVLEHL